MSLKRVFLSENEAPTAWYNIQADLPEPVPPPLNPATNEPIGPADLQPIFADELIAQEMTQERWVDRETCGTNAKRAGRDLGRLDDGSPSIQHHGP